MQTSPPGDAAAPPLTCLTAEEVAERVKYPKRQVRDWVRAGHFPPPIDPDRPAQWWRWSSLTIDAYCRGEWERAS